MKRISQAAWALFMLSILFPMRASSQTDFAPGEIMFTGYDSDAPDAFSFVLLKDVLSGTVIFITDRGWSNGGPGFRVDNTTEGTIELTFNNDYPCGTEVIFTDSEDANDWDNPVNQLGVVVGTVVIVAGGDPDGMELGTTGDQLFIYQSPTPTPGNQSSFVTAIHMDGAWSGTATTDDNSAKPTGLSDFQVVAFNAETDNAKYDCNPNTGTGAFLASVITNENPAGWLRPDNANNWIESDTYINLNTACNFCCTTNNLSGPDLVSTNQVFTIYITGTLPPGGVWQLYTAGCGVGSPVQTTMADSFNITAPGTEGNVTYYVRASNATECPGACVFINICVENTPLATCTSCTANPETCGDCLLPDTDPNPEIAQGCFQMRLIFILDESGSILGFEQDVEDGVLAFLNALNGQGIEAAFIEFSNLGTLITNYTLIDQTFIDNMFLYFNGGWNGQSYNPGGCTNWHDAMFEADALVPPADLILFFTDGDATCWNTTTSNNCGSSATTQTPEIVNPVKIANKLKGEGTHMFMLGVGSGIDVYNLQLMSGPVAYQNGVNTIGNADYSIGNFADLADDLEAFVEELCRTDINLEKELLGVVCNGVQQFMFIVENLGDLSAATAVTVTDTFPPSCYANIVYNGPFVKLCIGDQCDFGNGPEGPTVFQWFIPSVPPLSSDTLILSVNVLTTDSCTNIAWAQGSNTDLVSDTLESPNFEDDLAPIITCPNNVTVGCGSGTLPPATGTATAFDPDGSAPVLTYSDVTVAGTCPVLYVIQRTWVATDGCFNTDDCVQMISVSDLVGPVIACPANITISCTANTLPAATGTATSTDACDASPSMSFSDVTTAGSCPQEYVIQRTWTSGDDCNNISTCVQTITIDDNVGPTLTCPANVTILCTANTLPAATGTATATDICDVSATITYSDASLPGDCPQANTIARTWIATDDCGNSNTCVQTITRIDNISPSINCPPNVTIQCTASTLPASTGQPTSTDNCDVSPSITFADATIAGACPDAYGINRTWTTTDDCGNTNTCVQTITVIDSEAPGITCPPNVTISCTASTLPANTGSPLTNDNCDGAPEVVYADVTTASPNCAQEYTITRTWTSTDDCGNVAICSQTIVVDDNMGPVITCPSNITLECTDSTLPSEANGLATATDNCDGTPTVTSSDVTIAGACSQEMTIIRTWLATDDCGNTSTCTQTIVVDDSTPPVISCPIDLTIACTESTAPVNTGSATATDNCDSNPAITYSDATVGGGCPQEYTITRTWTATDDCGNVSTCTQIIVVDDDLPPLITCPADVTIECTASTEPGNTGTATATDNCDASPTITFSDVTTAGTCPQEYQIARTWTSTDDCGNVSSCTQSITIEDSTVPQISCPPDVTIECTAVTLPANTGTATATDNCDSSPVVTYTDATVAGSCAQEYVITRTWSVVDACGNSNSCTQVITVDDSTAPAIVCPADTTIECTEDTLPANTGAATATDNCDSSPAVTYADVTTSSPNCPQEYMISRTWTSTDACGNSTTCLQMITVDDSTLPDITCPPDITIECIDDTLPANTGTATATDNCDPAPELDYVDITTSIPGTNDYLIERTWTAVDACGNDNTCLQVITLTNPLDPEILGEPFDTICSGETVVFEAFNQGIDPTTFQWSFGSGANPPTAMGPGPHNVTYTYNATNGSVGAFVILTLTTPGCLAASDTVANIHVNAIPNAVITSPSGNPCVLQDKVFHPLAPFMPGFTYTWNFGAGANPPTGMGYGPHTVEYFTSGAKTVKLIVESNEAGASCIDSSLFGFTVNVCPGQIMGRVFLETTTSDTTGIANVNVRLFADQDLDGLPDNMTPVKNVFTNSQGFYTMAAVTPGYYVIRETQPVNYFSLWEDDYSEDYDSLSNVVPNDNIIPCTIEPNELDTRNYFAEVVSPGIISGYVFQDFNNNETPNQGEGIQGVTVQLHADNNTDGIPDPGGPLATTTSSTIGYYTFGGLNTGHYVLVEIQPDDFDNVKDFDKTDDGDAVPNTNMTNDTLPVTISNAETDSENYFIEITPCGQLVTTTQDNVPGSLRVTIECAEDGDTISFHSSLQGQTLVLDLGRIDIDKTLYIHSTLSPQITIKSNVTGAFKILAGHTVEFKNMNLISGLSGFDGAEFEIFGHLILWDIKIYPNPLLDPIENLIFSQPPGELTIKGMLEIHED